MQLIPSICQCMHIYAGIIPEQPILCLYKIQRSSVLLFTSVICLPKNLFRSKYYFSYQKLEDDEHGISVVCLSSYLFTGRSRSTIQILQFKIGYQIHCITSPITTSAAIKKEFMKPNPFCTVSDKNILLNFFCSY